MSSSKPIRVAILGAGMSLSVFHAPSVRSMPSKFALHSVLERTDRGMARAACGDGIKVVNSLEDVTSDPDVDLVVISTPNTTHFEYAKACLNAGKHEKPMCPTAAEAQKLLDLAMSKNLILSVYQNRRWDSDFLTLRKLLAAKTLGDINECAIQYDRYRPIPLKAGSTWKETPGAQNEAIYNLGSHVIDQAVVLFGLPERIYCRTWDQRGIGLDESFKMEMYYTGPGGRPLTVTTQATIMSPHPTQLKFCVKGSKGSFIKYGGDMQEADLKKLAANGGELKDIGKYGQEVPSIWGTVYLAKEDDPTKCTESKLESECGNYPALYHNLHEAISANDPSKLAVKPEEAIAVLKLIELGMRSSREGRMLAVEKA